MTMMAHYLAVLPANLAIGDLTGAWRSQVSSFVECRLQWLGAPDFVRAYPKTEPDWGTVAYEINEADVTPLTGKSSAVLPPLQPGERYAAIWVECY